MNLGQNMFTRRFNRQFYLREPHPRHIYSPQVVSQYRTNVQYNPPVPPPPLPPAPPVPVPRRRVAQQVAEPVSHSLSSNDVVKTRKVQDVRGILGTGPRIPSAFGKNMYKKPPASGGCGCGK